MENGVIVLVVLESLPNLLLDLLGIANHWSEAKSIWNCQVLTHVLFSQPDENSLDFSSCMLRPGIKNAQELACGVCLLNVDSRSRVSHMPSLADGKMLS